MSHGARRTFLLVLCYLVALEGLSWVPSPPGTRCIVYVTQQVSSAQQDNEADCGSFFVGTLSVAGRALHFLKSDDNDKAVVAFFTIILALSTIALWGSTYSLQQTTRELAGAAREEFLSTHRPRIRFKHVWLVSPFIYNSPIQIQILCVNRGVADATIFEYGVRCFVVPRGETRPIPNFDGKRINANIPAVSGITLTFPDVIYPLTQDEEIEVRQRGGQFYCVGYLHYKDAIGRILTTAFCRVLAPPAGHPTSVARRFVKVDDPDYEYED